MTTTTSIAYLVDGQSSINLIFGNDHYTVSSGHPNHFEILCALQDKRYDDVEILLNVASSIASRTNGLITFEDNKFYYNGPSVKGTPEPLHSALVNRMFDLIEGGFSAEYLIRFAENMFQNPRPEAVEELYLFLQHNKLSITEDGCFLAYKRVNQNWRDCYSDTLDNSIGATVKEDYDKVDPDRNNTCSKGLHFCDFGYLTHFGGAHTVLVKINPKDVVAIPSDYSNQKGRCCEYVVVKEHEYGDTKDVFEGKNVVPLYTAKGEKSTKSFHNLRDKRGRFTSQADREKDENYRHNARNALGRFVSRLVGVKVPKTEPDLPYHNVRDSGGRFAPKK